MGGCVGEIEGPLAVKTQGPGSAEEGVQSSSANPCEQNAASASACICLSAAPNADAGVLVLLLLPLQSWYGQHYDAANNEFAKQGATACSCCFPAPGAAFCRCPLTSRTSSLDRYAVKGRPTSLGCMACQATGQIVRHNTLAALRRAACLSACQPPACLPADGPAC